MTSADAIDDLLLIAQLADVANERDHDLGNDLQAFLVELAGGFHDGAGLHLGDLGIGDAQTHAAVAEHRVELVELLDARQQRLLVVEVGLPFCPWLSITAISTIRSSRFGRNSCSGGSIVRMVTGVPFIALNTP